MLCKRVFFIWAFVVFFLLNFIFNCTLSLDDPKRLKTPCHKCIDKALFKMYRLILKLRQIDCNRSATKIKTLKREMKFTIISNSEFLVLLRMHQNVLNFLTVLLTVQINFVHVTSYTNNIE